jgi:hypothetical protein
MPPATMTLLRKAVRPAESLFPSEESVPAPERFATLEAASLVF